MLNQIMALLLCVALVLACAPTAWGLWLITPAFDPNDDPVLMEQIYAVVNEVAKEYPAVRGAVVTTAPLQNGIYAAATAVGDYTKIEVNEFFTTDPDKLGEWWESDAAIGFHPPLGRCTAAQALAYHEAAHLIDRGDRLAARRELYETFSAREVRDELSEYSFRGRAAFQPGEALAEAFSSVRCNGGNPTEQEIYKLLTT